MTTAASTTVTWHDAVTTLPDDGIRCLVALTDGEVSTAYHDDSEWWDDNDNCYHDDVTHWADLPDPP